MVRQAHAEGAQAIAVVGLGCWYPGARGPRELWENVLARRRQFRRLPDCRLSLDAYHDPDPAAPDKTYGRRAAVIDGFRFDWAGHRIPKKTYEGTDVVQWFALEVARQALEDAGYSRESVPRDRTGVILGNTLTGEHTRSNTMRLRWPYVRRALMAAAERKGMSASARAELAELMETLYKSVFPAVTEDTLAGGLSNTIAGRICNLFDFHGGGYTVDGACASSLLAVTTAAERLASGQLDLALAGGVDVSLDTFELIGFAKTGALTADDMRVYDRRASGFIPGEGCGFVVLKRLEDARAAGDHVYAVIRGWGISSDGKGGITAPNREGQAMAIRRAYEVAGYGPEQLDFVEGHGTGTRVGDRVELEALASVLGNVAERTCGMTSLKSIIGHTKAAAGVGALIKAVIAVNRRVLPPTAGCARPSEVFETAARSLYPILRGEVAEPTRRLRAGVSAMGFGGINSHITLESGDGPSLKLAPEIAERALMAARQETEVFVFGSDAWTTLCDRLTALAREAEALSQAELTDLAARLAREAAPRPAVRAAVLAATPDELAARFGEMAAALRTEPPGPGQTVAGPAGTWWAGAPSGGPRLGFLFPGQGSQQLQMAQALVDRHPWAARLVADADRWLAEVGAAPVSAAIDRPVERAKHAGEFESWTQDLARTEVAQPAVCLASMLYGRQLTELGLSPIVVGGHSLGELSALHAAGAFDAETLMKLAAVRGRLLAAPPDRPGAMAGLACSAADAESLIAGIAEIVCVANLNGPRQTVISGDEAAVIEAMARATERGIGARRLPVSNAFHSPLVAGAARELRVQAPVPPTVGGLAIRVLSGASESEGPIAPGADLPAHLAAQVVARVDFLSLARRMAEGCDLLIEVGPGGVLSSLVAEIVGPGGPACMPVAARVETADRDLNAVLASAFVLGAAIRWENLYRERLVRPYVPASDRLFLDNPCERPFSIAVTETLAPAGQPEADALETMLAEATGATPERLQHYLARRRRFLTEVIRADLSCLEDACGPISTPAVPPPPVPRAAAPNGMHESTAHEFDLEAMLLDMAAEQTGFPRSALTRDARLLDDLNLDSIKAAELVAGAAKAVGVAGLVDPSSLANSSIAEAAAAIRAALGGRPAQHETAVAPTSAEPVPTTVQTDDGPSWVRYFIIEHVPEAA
jgi:acyl transferase domain-containing protein